jgi:hypothetical protein
MYIAVRILHIHYRITLAVKGKVLYRETNTPNRADNILSADLILAAIYFLQLIRIAATIEANTK